VKGLHAEDPQISGLLGCVLSRAPVTAEGNIVMAVPVLSYLWKLLRRIKSSKGMQRSDTDFWVWLKADGEKKPKKQEVKHVKKEYLKGH
jgi:hypothetical protein